MELAESAAGVGFVVLATVCAAMEARPFPHLPHDALRHETDLAPSRAGSLAALISDDQDETGWRVAGASTGRIPLPLWMSGIQLWSCT
ncbi:hypothetical protein GCM10010372_26380 [Streptomyces tauricus]|nr:hypothetical protein GCM10010372_26380 [Streptomyces tauricus]